MTDEYGVTDEGFVLKDYSAILSSMQKRTLATFADQVDISDTTFAGQLLQVVAYELAIAWQELEAIYYAGYLNTSTKTNLDAISMIQGITRKAATYAGGTVRFSRSDLVTQDYVVPLGTRVSNADGSLIYATTVAATLPIDSAYVDIAVQCTAAGTDGNIASGLITHMIDSVSGVESVTNPSAMTGGTDAESDAMLRLRTRVPSTGNKATILAIEQALAAVSGVVTVLVVENTTNHTITCYVLGGEDEDLNAVIAETRPCGIVASLARPNPVPVAVTCTVLKSSTVTNTEVLANIQAALASYFGGLDISGDVTYSDIIRTVANATGVVNVTVLTATDGTTTIDALGESIVIPDNSIATDGTHTISVT